MPRSIPRRALPHRLLRALAMLRAKAVEAPAKKHDNIPL